MKSQFLLTGLLGLVISLSARAQPLTMYRTFGGARFEYLKDTTLLTVSPKQVAEILSDDPLASAEFKKARSNYTFAGILGFAGGVMVGIPVGTAIGGGEPEWALAAGGAALIIATIPLTKAFQHQAQSAIDGYNGRHTSMRPSWRYWFAGTRMGVVYKF